jgi:hypothetical protein
MPKCSHWRKYFGECLPKFLGGGGSSKMMDRKKKQWLNSLLKEKR